MSKDTFTAQLARAIIGPELKRLEKSETDLAIENSQLTGNHIGFFYSGHIFRLQNIVGNLGSIHDSLKDEADFILDQRKELENDQQEIKQILHLLTKGLTSAQDIQDALPECLRQFFKYKHERQKEEAWSIKDNPSALKSYHQINEKIHFYLAKRLLH